MVSGKTSLFYLVSYFSWQILGLEPSEEVSMETLRKMEEPLIFLRTAKNHMALLELTKDGVKLKKDLPSVCEILNSICDSGQPHIVVPLSVGSTFPSLSLFDRSVQHKLCPLMTSPCCSLWREYLGYVLVHDYHTIYSDFAFINYMMYLQFTNILEVIFENTLEEIGLFSTLFKTLFNEYEISVQYNFHFIYLDDVYIVSLLILEFLA